MCLESDEAVWVLHQALIVKAHMSSLSFTHYSPVRREKEIKSLTSDTGAILSEQVIKMMSGIMQYKLMCKETWLDTMKYDDIIIIIVVFYSLKWESEQLWAKTEYVFAVAINEY